MLTPDFENRLKAQVDFPSPSSVATQIITLARNPDIEMSKVAQAIGRDPAMAAKIMRIANSAFYAQRRPCQSLKQALVVIGLNAALTLALSFSLVSSIKALRPAGIDYPRFWRRALLAATAARAFGEAGQIRQTEELFLAGLLQDIGVLAIDRAARDFYDQLPKDCGHSEWISYEKPQLGRDHADCSALLLRTWQLPERIWQAVAASHAPQTLAADSPAGTCARCLAMGSDLAESILAGERHSLAASLARRARELLDLSPEGLTEVITRILRLIPEIEELYETRIIDPDEADNLLAEARELLAVRNLHALQEVSNLQATASALLTRTEEAEDSSRRDPLTGALNRAWLERLLDREFTQAVVFGRDLSIAHLDIDHFKTINDKFGTDVGDRVLADCARKLSACVRAGDLVARYNGEEFMIVLPGADRETAKQVAERLLNALTKVDLDLEHELEHEPLRISVSIGLATYNSQRRFPSTLALLEAADHALYAAKLCGRNRWESFDELAAAS